MNNFIVSGASSMLGAAFCRLLEEKNKKILALVRPDSKRLGAIPKSAEIAESDISEIDKLKFNQRYDAFVHFAWANTYREDRLNPFKQYLNIEYALKSVEAAKNAGCSVFVFAGSQAEYGRAEGLINENYPLNADNAYGICKNSASLLAKNLCSEYGIRYVHTRIFSVYGEYDTRDSLISKLILSLLKNERLKLTKCEQVWDYLYCGDCAEAFYLLSEKGAHGEAYNIGSGEAKRLSEYVNIVLSFFPGRQADIGGLPYSENQVMNLRPDISKLKALGFTVKTDFKAGIAKIIEHLK